MLNKVLNINMERKSNNFFHILITHRISEQMVQTILDLLNSNKTEYCVFIMKHKEFLMGYVTSTVIPYNYINYYIVNKHV
jgi:hypothetical protein